MILGDTGYEQVDKPKVAFILVRRRDIIKTAKLCPWYVTLACGRKSE